MAPLTFLIYSLQTSIRHLTSKEILRGKQYGTKKDCLNNRYYYYFFLLLGVVSMLSGVIFADSIQNYDLEAYIWINGLAQLVLSFALLLIMRKLQLFNRSEYSISGFGKGLFAGLLGIVFALFMFLVNYIGNVSFAHVPSFSYLFACLLIALTTGLFEELLVRGFAFNSFKECFGNSVSGIKKAIVWSSVLFGLIHVVNLGGYDLASVLTTLSQIISAIIVGMFFALVA